MSATPVPLVRKLRIALVLPLLLVATLATTAAAQAERNRPLPVSELQVGSEVVATTGLRLSAIGTPDDGSGRLFVVDKAGRILVFHPETGVLDPQPLLDLTSRVSTAGNERGLLGVAPSPDFERTHTLFVSYTALGTGVENGALTVSRFVLDSADQAVVDPSTEERVLRQQHNLNSNHNGGDLTFGPDGYLYWSTGDGGSADDPLYGAQNLSTLLGKIVRIDVMRECDGRLYCIPKDNPFARSSIARPEIWAWGLRNPWRFSIDAGDESIWIGDVGQNRWEEINHVSIDDDDQPRDGWNFGWSCREGADIHRVPESAGEAPDPFIDIRCNPRAEYTDPVFSYGLSGNDRCAVMGGVVYRGEEFEDIADGTYVAADYCTGQAFAIQEQRRGRHAANDAVGMLPPRITSFGVDDDGEVYFVTDAVAGGTGQIHRLTFAEATAP
ncbi:PQQ-dependent sugar dehydrogenase [Jiangella rhizosphaerae]|uniref:Glucose/sorbosone dehydrogenase-like protein n=1 Tax=Jiangella rhizosphaerae TaxID=2293569 RepID=A0A418KW44_9ACTN|nr:PQQ-dependent sugar dehydrogenase [Jiangella rhizosphaerae]RIQ33681.1 glucose/sorbosone dehydrogenase-like protein [Jiangella rhizosphaerae]